MSDPFEILKSDNLTSADIRITKKTDTFGKASVELSVENPDDFMQAAQVFEVRFPENGPITLVSNNQSLRLDTITAMEYSAASTIAENIQWAALQNTQTIRFFGGHSREGVTVYYATADTPGFYVANPEYYTADVSGFQVHVYDDPTATTQIVIPQDSGPDLTRGLGQLPREQYPELYEALKVLKPGTENPVYYSSIGDQRTLSNFTVLEKHQSLTLNHSSTEDNQYVFEIKADGEETGIYVTYDANTRAISLGDSWQNIEVSEAMLKDIPVFQKIYDMAATHASSMMLSDPNPQPQPQQQP